VRRVCVSQPTSTTRDCPEPLPKLNTKKNCYYVPPGKTGTGFYSLVRTEDLPPADDVRQRDGLILLPLAYCGGIVDEDNVVVSRARVVDLGHLGVSAWHGELFVG
jgi:hypothetical protein